MAPMATPVSNVFPADGISLDSLDKAVAGLAEGSAWTFGNGSHVLTYALHDINFGEVVQGWTPTRIASIGQAYAAWAAVADIRFTRIAATTDVADSPANLALAFQHFGPSTAPGGEIAAFGLFPDPAYLDSKILPASGDTRATYPHPEGDIYFNIDYANTVANGPGSFWFLVALHEIGHTLGLKHPQDDGGNGRPTFIDLGIGATDDGYHTVMTYHDLPRPSANAGYQVTPMPYDILAIQAIYGTNDTYRLDDSTWSGADNRTVRTIWDAGGNDTIDFAGSSRPVQIDLLDTGGHVYQVGNIAAVAVAFGVALENVTGSRFADSVTGTDGDNVLRGNGGNDFLAGFEGNDLLDGGAGADTLSGGDGDDTYVIDNIGDVIVEQPVGGPVFGPGAGGIDEVRSSISFTLADNLEDLVLTGTAAIDGTGNDGSNGLIGNAAANRLFGLGGDDAIDGGAGADFIDGGDGIDQMMGGPGNDTFVVGQSSDQVTELSGEGYDIVRSTVDFALPDDVEELRLEGGATFGTGNAMDNRLVGSVGNNELAGLAGADYLDGGAGADTRDGGAGNDTFVVDNVGDQVIEAADGGIDTVMTSVAFVMPETVENVVLTGILDLVLIGNAADNLLRGNVGNNLIDGRHGHDSVFGGAGNDTYVVDANDVVTELPGEGTDELQYGGSGGATLDTDVENLTLIAGLGALAGAGNATANVVTGNDSRNLLDGGAGNDRLFGAGGDDTLTGGAGDDLLDGGRGGDDMLGGAGNDTYRVDYVRDAVGENAGGGIDTVESTLRDYTLPANVENLILTGTGPQNGSGNDLANTIDGNAFANVLTGGAGADRFVFNDAPGASNVDTVTDFTSCIDRLILDHAVFAGLAPGVLGAAAFRSGSGLVDSVAPEDRLLFDTATGALSFDADGSGGGAAVVFAILAGGHPVVAHDFVVI